MSKVSGGTIVENLKIVLWKRANTENEYEYVLVVWACRSTWFKLWSERCFEVQTGNSEGLTCFRWRIVTTSATRDMLEYHFFCVLGVILKPLELVYYEIWMRYIPALKSFHNFYCCLGFLEHAP